MYREEEFSRLEISLPACLENYRYFRSKLADTTKLLVLVKANAYGHGCENIIKILDKKVDFFAVHNLQEALNVRKNTNKTILILGYCYDLKIAIENDISIMVDSVEILNQITQLKTNKKAKIHIKINTGMNRLGIKKIKK